MESRAQAQAQPFGDVLRAKILQPLGMTMTAVGLDDAMRTHLARRHNRHNQEDILRYLKANNGRRGRATSVLLLLERSRRNWDDPHLPIEA
jgi:CubicO group peptidase (beta-lactamase class C family)